MPHQFAAINCRYCEENYCPVCHEFCPKCGKDGIESDEYREKMRRWRELDKKRKEDFGNKKDKKNKKEL